MSARLVITAALAAAFSTNANACAVCMGSDDAKTAYASNSVLWCLLALVGFIFIATGATAYFLWHHNRLK